MLLDLRLAPSEQPWPGDDEESQIDKEHERNGAGHRVEKNPRSLDITKDVPSEEKQANRDHGHVSLRERISHVTWANYTLTMSTGGIAGEFNLFRYAGDSEEAIDTLVNRGYFDN